MKQNILSKFLPLAAAILLATSCSKDSDNTTQNVVPNPDPEVVTIPDGGTRQVPFSVTVNTGNSLSKITYADTKVDGKMVVLPSFEEKDANMEMKITSADDLVTGTLKLSNWKTGTFSGPLTVRDEATDETALTGTIIVPASGDNSNVSTRSIEDLMGKCGHTYQANFNYGSKDRVDLVDVANSYLEIFLEGGTSVDINVTPYTLNSDGRIWLMLAPDTKITSEALGIEDRTTAAGKIHTIFRIVKGYTGAELYTFEDFRYGKFETRMKMAAASGTVSSMFLYQDGSEIADGRPWVEIDLEVLGKEPGSFQSNIITGKAGAQKTSEKHHTVDPAAHQAFHTYAIEWTPKYVRWTVDGKEVRKTVTDENNIKDQVANLKGTQGLRFNLWSSESAEWVGEFDESALPLFQFINWVKVYKYTPGTGEGGGDFTLDWTDNFDYFDGNRWGKVMGTFVGNRVFFTDKNVYTQDGMLILALTRKGQEFFSGAVPKDDQQ